MKNLNNNKIVIDIESETPDQLIENLIENSYVLRKIFRTSQTHQESEIIMKENLRADTGYLGKRPESEKDIAYYYKGGSKGSFRTPKSNYIRSFRIQPDQSKFRETIGDNQKLNPQKKLKTDQMSDILKKEEKKNNVNFMKNLIKTESEKIKQNFACQTQGKSSDFTPKRCSKSTDTSITGLERIKYPVALNSDHSDSEEAPYAVPCFAKLLDKLVNSEKITEQDLEAAKIETFRTFKDDGSSQKISSFTIFLLVLDNKFYASDKREKSSFTYLKSNSKILEQIKSFLNNPTIMKSTKRRKNEEFRKKIFKSFLNNLHRILNPHETKGFRKQRCKIFYKKYHREIIKFLMSSYTLEKFAEEQKVSFTDKITLEGLKKKSPYDFTLKGPESEKELAFIKIYFTCNS